MNFAWYAFARALAVVVVAFFLMAIQSIGIGLHEWRGKPSLEKLGSRISDQGKYQIDMWYWPPQLRLSGRFRGTPFLYEKASHNATHILVECLPVADLETSRHHPSRLPAGISYERLDNQFPDWTSLFSSQKSVSWRKRSLDRRPLGLGTAPGIDLYRQAADPLDPRQVRADLEGLLSYCAASK